MTSSIERAKELLARLESGTEGVYLVPVKDLLAWAISVVDAMEGDNPYVWDGALHGFEQLFGEDTQTLLVSVGET